jgi:hypothetical protein
MRQIAPIPEERPAWVDSSISELRRLERAIDSHRELLTQIAFALTAQGVKGAEGLADANHDLEHAWKHIGSLRRSLAMVWPSETDGQRSNG